MTEIIKFDRKRFKSQGAFSKMLILQILFLFCSINFVYSGATAKEEQVTIPVAIQKLTGSESMTSAEGMEEFFKEANATLAKFDEDS